MIGKIKRFKYHKGQRYGEVGEMCGMLIESGEIIEKLVDEGYLVVDAEKEGELREAIDTIIDILGWKKFAPRRAKDVEAEINATWDNEEGFGEVMERLGAHELQNGFYAYIKDGRLYLVKRVIGGIVKAWEINPKIWFDFE